MRLSILIGSLLWCVRRRRAMLAARSFSGIKQCLYIQVNVGLPPREQTSHPAGIGAAARMYQPLQRCLGLPRVQEAPRWRIESVAV
ncbi:hypothetical protein CO2235_210021 [Cupriavidus oxalaticus]|uniref:Uncharacterized protein n=1 Tax=Cupriavidus oxalaticus TaxID=96344 RepID=A0A976BD79_9BURK|nr:hypothetical protein CO2235_210021 [Cupriavidus oxalaticus]